MSTQPTSTNVSITTNAIPSTRLAMLLSPDHSVVSTALHTWQPQVLTNNTTLPPYLVCTNTLLDTGAVHYNVMNDVLANQVVSQLDICIDACDPIELIAYDNTSQFITKIITIDYITVQLPDGVKTFTDVDFLITPSNGHTEPELILSNAFLKEKCKYQMISNLSSHIKKFLGMDTNPFPEFNLVNSEPSTCLTQQELITLCNEADDSDPADLAPT